MVPQEVKPFAVLEVPIHTVSEANTRGHWGAKNARAQDQRETIKLVASAHLRASALPRNLVVKLVRIGVGHLDDDNLRGAFKAIRDGLADFIGIDDKHVDLVRYEYGQEKCPRGEWGVRVEFYPMHSATST